MNKIKETAKKIKELKIQGARNITIEALKAFSYQVKKTKAVSKKEFFNKLFKARDILTNSRPTEPMMRNTLKYVLFMSNVNELENIKDIKKIVMLYIGDVLKALEESKKKVAEIGAKRIPKNATIFTHCHSSTVTAVLQKASNKNIKVICTETRPRYQGRLTAKELVNYGIDTTIIVDSSANRYIKKCNLVLIGADVITLEGIYNKVGSSMISHFAEQYDVPLYIAAESWKFSPSTIKGNEEKIEQRSPKEVWLKPPKGLKIKNPAFDFVEKDEINGIITETGIISNDVIYDTFKEKYPWMF